MIRIVIILLIIIALFGGAFFVYQKGQERFSPASINSAQQPLNDLYVPPTPPTTIEEDYTALEIELDEIKKMETEFNQELEGLE